MMPTVWPRGQLFVFVTRNGIIVFVVISVTSGLLFQHQIHHYRPSGLEAACGAIRVCIVPAVQVVKIGFAA
jgi:hypothetical protein